MPKSLFFRTNNRGEYQGSSWASCHNLRHSFALSGFALAIILSQCIVSLASF
ncbi:hypothetical protein KJ636_01335 [Patescibacteria group bacterium]|nr:hypothetical protein [Patescibacteria group bacterium]MBU4481031.1 hypothetical protein [Patescibacteria group bacterium]